MKYRIDYDEYDEKIKKIYQYLQEDNLNIDSNIDLNKIKLNIIGMAPKVVGIFLEKILIYYYHIDNNGNINSANDGIYQTETIEVKSSRAIYTKKNPTWKTEYEKLHNYERKLLSIKDLNILKFDSNIQQVKPKYFDKIYYGILTQEGFLVFKLNKNQLLNNEYIAYSDKQHRGNIGEGQFHIYNRNIGYHILNHYEGTISWFQILEILKKINI